MQLNGKMVVLATAQDDCFAIGLAEAYSDGPVYLIKSDSVTQMWPATMCREAKTEELAEYWEIHAKEAEGRLRALGKS